MKTLKIDLNKNFRPQLINHLHPLEIKSFRADYSAMCQLYARRYISEAKFKSMKTTLIRRIRAAIRNKRAK